MYFFLRSQLRNFYLRPWRSCEMNFRLAGDGASITASFLVEVEVGISEYRCHHPVYVTLLQDSMLLGIDVLQANHICLSCGSEEFWFNGSTEAHRMHKPNTENQGQCCFCETVARSAVVRPNDWVWTCRKFGSFLVRDRVSGWALFTKHLNSPSERGKIWFTALDHRIDTDDARPVNQLMRRTPTVIHWEEEGHLDKMLAAGVIHASISDWA